MSRKASTVRREEGKQPERAAAARRWPNLKLVKHPLAEHKLTYMRDQQCSTNRFRELTRELGALLAVEVTRDHLPMRQALVTTDAVANTKAQIMADKPVLVALLRSGLVLVDGALSIITAAHIGHIGLAHDDKHQPMDYLVALPEPRDRPFIVMDIAVGSGNMACYAISILIEIGVKPENIVFATVLIAPEGLQRLLEEHPTVKVYALREEDGIDKDNHVVPGFGNAEERLFGA